MKASEAALVEARRWLGTPYRHQASRMGVGCDCLGLVRGVWRSLYGAEPEATPPYRPDWAEVGGEERLLEAARRWLVEKPVAAAEPGAVLVFRRSPDAAAKPCALMSEAGEPGKIIHAYWGRAVVESWLGECWRRRLVAAFAFPEIGDVEWRR